MVTWIRLPRSIRCKHKWLHADVWPVINLKGEKEFRYTIMNKVVYVANGAEPTEEKACRKCEQLMEK